MIELKNITKKFGSFTAIDDLSIEIKKGNIVGLLGPNGAGKTTTMRMLTGYLTPDQGKVFIGNTELAKNEIASKTRIGYMPENNPLYGNMLVKEFLNLTLNLNNVPKDKRKDRIDYVVKAVGIESKYYKQISELSKGYKQRVGLAAALISDPDILILDEPTEGLDPNQRTEIRNLIKELGENRTVIISTHVMQEVEAMCNRIIIINEGKIVKDGDKKSVLNRDQKDIIEVKIKEKVKKDGIKEHKSYKVLKCDSSSKSTNIQFEVEDEKSVYEDISREIHNNKWTIYKLDMKTTSLEDIFHELTQK